VNRLLNDKSLRQNMSINTLEKIVSTAWENSAVSHAVLFEKVAPDKIGLHYDLPAINAGPSRPRSWRGQPGAPVLEAAIWAENVPFQETRDYVKKVLANTTSYAALITGQPQSLKSRLGLVGPRAASAPEPNNDLP
jgi:hypothetical protein